MTEEELKKLKEQHWKETLDRFEGPPHPLDLILMLPPQPLLWPPKRKLVLMDIKKDIE